MPFVFLPHHRVLQQRLAGAEAGVGYGAGDAILHAKFFIGERGKAQPHSLLGLDKPHRFAWGKQFDL
ncbi:hypothetical protein D3C73_802770 [compost metagenome]